MNRYTPRTNRSTRRPSALRNAVLEAVEPRRLMAVLDSTFGNNGVVTTTGFGNSPEVDSLLVQPDGKVVVAGSGSLTPTDRFNTNGTIDTSFNNVSLPGINILAMVRQNDGKIVVGGRNNDTQKPVVARINADGSVDTSFAANGIRVLDNVPGFTGQGQVHDLAIDASNNIVGVGSMGAVIAAPNVEQSNGYAFRLLPNGRLDTGFSGDGYVDMTPAYYAQEVRARSTALLLRPDGKILVGGAMYTYDYLNRHSDRFYIGALNQDGSIDNTFGTGGFAFSFVSSTNSYNTVSFYNFNSMAFRADGKIIAVGGDNYWDSRFGGDYFNRGIVVQVTAFGTADTGFGTNGQRTWDVSSQATDRAGARNSEGWFDDIRVLPDNSFAIAGRNENSADGGRYQGLVLKFKANNSFDTTFDNDGIYFDANVNGYEGMDLTSDGKLVVAGAWKPGLFGSNQHVVVQRMNINYNPYGSLSGLVFNDLNGDGNQNNGEGGLANQSVYLDNDRNGYWNNNEPKTNTDGSGNYRFDNLAIANYDVRVIVQNNWQQTVPSAARNLNVVAGTNVVAGAFGLKYNEPPPTPVTTFNVRGSITHDDTGNAPQSSIRVYVDANNNSVFDSSERSAFTDTSGAFSLSGLANGSYTLRIVLPSGTVQTSPSSGALVATVNNNDVNNLRFRIADEEPLGGPLTIDGTSGRDTILVTLVGESILVTLNGDETDYPLSDYEDIEVYAGDGDDRVTVAASITLPVYINGGSGNDSLTGGAGNDTITGGAGKNTLRGGAGNDALNGSNGKDFAYGGEGEDRIKGNGGDDILWGEAGVDRIWGGDGNDELVGGASNDKLYGGAGNDRLTGAKGRDILNGDTGVDTSDRSNDDNRISIEILA